MEDKVLRELPLFFCSDCKKMIYIGKIKFVASEQIG